MPKNVIVVLVFVASFFLLNPSASFAANNQKQNSARLRICQTREGTIKQRFERITNISNVMIESFDFQAQKVQNYYSQNLVPKGKTVPNYGNLVTDIQTKKTAVQISLSKARAEAVSFSCTAGEPQKFIRDFRTYSQETNTAFKNYRTSVKNLIVAVRTATNTVE